MLGSQYSEAKMLCCLAIISAVPEKSRMDYLKESGLLGKRIWVSIQQPEWFDSATHYRTQEELTPTWLVLTPYRNPRTGRMVGLPHDCVERSFIAQEFYAKELDWDEMLAKGGETDPFRLAPDEEEPGEAYA